MKPFLSNLTQRPRIKRRQPFLVLLLLLVFLTVVQSKEIIATNEWQLIKEGDTVPAGLHIRMDLSTGGKWAKLVSDDKDEQQQLLTDNDTNEKDVVSTEETTTTYSVSCIEGGTCEKSDDSKSVSSSVLPLTTTNSYNKEEEDAMKSEKGTKIMHLTNTKISQHTSNKITTQLLAQEEEQKKKNKKKLEYIASLNDFESDTTGNETDVEMMYRTLQSLPKEELDRIELPSMDDENFNEQIKSIWNQRQEELRKWESELLKHTPASILQERIKFLQQYISSPIQYLQQQLLSEEDNGILWVLDDLQFQLMDIDMSRDFHTMGGWPLLVSLTAESIHGLPIASTGAPHEQQQLNNYNATAIDKNTEELQKIVLQVQSLASSTIGSAVKNIDEFHSWALEDIEGRDQLNNKEKNTVLDILVSNLDLYTENKVHYHDLFVKKMYRELHALGGLLRGNRKAIHYFTLIDGQDVLQKMMESIFKNTNVDSSNMYVKRLIVRTMTLAQDILMELTLHPFVDNEKEKISMKKEIDDMTMDLFSTEEWCSTPLQSLRNYSESSSSSFPMKLDILEIIFNMVPYCSYNSNDIHSIRSVVLKDDDEEQQLLNGFKKILKIIN